MSKKFLLLFVALCTTVASWGYYNGEVVRYDKLAQVSGHASPEGFLFQITDNTDGALKACVYKYEGSQDKIEVPRVVRVAGEGGQEIIINGVQAYAFGAGLKKISFEEGFTDVSGYYPYANASDLEELALPSTLKSFCHWHNAGSINKLCRITVPESSQKVKVLQTAEGCDCIVVDGELEVLLGKKHSDGSKPIVTVDGIDIVQATLPAEIKKISKNGYCNIGTAVYETIVLPAGLESIDMEWPKNYANLRGYKLSGASSVFSIYNPEGCDSKYGGFLVKGDEIVTVPVAFVYGVTNSVFEVIDLTIGNSSIHKVGRGAFNGVRKVENVVLTHDIREIGVGAFDTCSDLKTLTVYNCTSIGDSFVGNCDKLEDVILKDCTGTCEKLWQQDAVGVIYSMDWSQLLICPKTVTFDIASGKNYTEYTIHNGCKEIADRAFYGNTSLQSVKLNEVEKVGNAAFRHVDNLFAVVIPETVDSIKGYAFYECDKLATIHFMGTDAPGPSANDILSKKPLAISSYAFDCGVYTEVYIPARATEVGAVAFRNDNLANIYICPGTQMSKWYQQGKTDVLKKVEFIRTQNTEYDDICKLTEIADDAFKDRTELTTVNILPSVTTLGERAFTNTPNLKNLTIAEGCKITGIKENAFENCGLEKMPALDDCVKIGFQAFHYCPNLTEVNIGRSCTSVDVEAFAGCDNLEAINVDRQNTTYASCNGFMTTKDKKTLYIYPAGRASEYFELLPPSLEKIGEKACYLNKKLKTIVIPKKVKSIGNKAFCGCDNLKDIYFMGTAVEAVTAEVAADGDNDRRFASEDGLITSQQFLHDNVTMHWPSCYGWYDENGFWGKNIDDVITTTSIYADDYKNHGYGYKMKLKDGTESLILIQFTDEDWTSVVPAQNQTGWKITHIADYAFEDLSDKVHEIVFRNDVKYLGVNLFDANAPETIFFAPESKNVYDINSSATLFDIGYLYFTDKDDSYFPLKNHEDVELVFPYDMWKDGKVYSQQYKHDTFTTSHYQQRQISCVASLPKITDVNSTFSREFDVHLSNRAQDGTIQNQGPATQAGEKPEDIGNKPDVCAYVAYKDKMTEGSNWVSIVLESVNCGNNGFDGTYIPANCGALIQATPGKNYNGSFFYEIGMNKSINSVANNVFHEVVKNNQTVAATEGGKFNYYIYEGKFWNVPAAGFASFPIHKAYLSLDEQATTSAKELRFFFSQQEADAFAATAINGVNADTKADVIYDLSGRRVNAPQKGGVYVKNGKKVVL